MNRRKLVLGSAATALSVALPSTASAKVERPKQGGLGLTMQQFIALHGNGVPYYGTRLDGVYFPYDDRGLLVAEYGYSGKYRIYMITQGFDEEHRLASDAPELWDWIGKFLPEDAVYLGDIDTNPNGLPSIFHSDELAERYADLKPYWKPGQEGGQLGDFSIYFDYDQRSRMSGFQLVTGIEWFSGYSDYDLP